MTLVMINFNGKGQFLIWFWLGYLSIYCCCDNIITGTPTDCIADLLTPFEEIVWNCSLSQYKNSEICSSLRCKWKHSSVILNESQISNMADGQSVVCFSFKCITTMHDTCCAFDTLFQLRKSSWFAITSYLMLMSFIPRVKLT